MSISTRTHPYFAVSQMSDNEPDFSHMTTTKNRDIVFLDVENEFIFCDEILAKNCSPSFSILKKMEVAYR